MSANDFDAVFDGAVVDGLEDPEASSANAVRSPDVLANAIAAFNERQRQAAVEQRATTSLTARKKLILALDAEQRAATARASDLSTRMHAQRDRDHRAWCVAHGKLISHDPFEVSNAPATPEYQRLFDEHTRAVREVEAIARKHQAWHPSSCELSTIVREPGLEEILVGLRPSACGRTRRFADCPVAPDDHEHLLVTELTGIDFRAACLGGCSPDEIRVALQPRIDELVAAETARREAAEATKVAEAEARDAVEREALDRESGLDDVPAEAEPWPVQDLIANGLNLWIGETGAAKSWMMCDGGIHLAAGRTWLGRSIAAPLTVGLVFLEGRAVNKARIRPMCRALGFEYEAIKDRLRIYPHELKSEDPESCARFVAWLRQHGIDVVIIDSYKHLRANQHQSASNDESASNAVARPLATLAHDGDMHGHQVGWPVRVVLLAHGDGATGRARGSKTLNEEADWCLGFERQGKAEESPIEIVQGIGCRLAAVDLPITVRVRGLLSKGEDPRVELVVKSSGPAVAETGADELTPRQVAIVAIVGEAPGLGLNEIHRRVGERLGGNPSKGAVRADIAALVADGMLVSDGAPRPKYSVASDE